MSMSFLRRFAKRAKTSHNRGSVRNTHRDERGSKPAEAGARPIEHVNALHAYETATIVSTFKVAGSVDGRFVIMNLSLCDHDETVVSVAVPHESIDSVVDTIMSIKQELWERRSQPRH